MKNTEYVAKSLVYKYNIYVDGKCVESNIIGWRTALKRARLRNTDLFQKPRKVEIHNAWTSEIIDIEEAEKRANKYKASKAVISGTT